LNSDGDSRFIKLAAEVGSETGVSIGDAGLSRPVPLSVDSGPLPLWLASVVIEVKRGVREPEWSAELQNLIIAEKVESRISNCEFRILKGQSRLRFAIPNSRFHFPPC